MGLVTSETKPQSEVWNFQPHTSFSGERRGAGDWVNNHSWLCNEASMKIPNYGVWRASGLVEFTLNSIGSEAPVLGTFLDLILCTSSFGCSCFLYKIFSNKPVGKSVSISYWAIIANDQNWEGGCGNPRFVAMSDRSVGNLGTQHILAIGIWRKGQSCGMWGLKSYSIRGYEMGQGQKLRASMYETYVLTLGSVYQNYIKF